MLPFKAEREMWAKKKARSHVGGETVLSVRRTNRPKAWRRRTG